MKKKKADNYFGEREEAAFRDYCLTNDSYEKHKIYMEIIGPKLDEMIEKIVQKYNFYKIPNIEELKSDCKVYTSARLEKFKPESGKKAFSYFTVIIKHYFYKESKENTSKKKKFVDIEEEYRVHSDLYEQQESKIFGDQIADSFSRMVELHEFENPKSEVLADAIAKMLKEKPDVNLTSYRVSSYLKNETGIRGAKYKEALEEVKYIYMQLMGI